jgi:hypothetical protein
LKTDLTSKCTITMSNHCLLEKKCLRLALKYELGRSCICIRLAALVYLTFGTSLVVWKDKFLIKETIVLLYFWCYYAI